MFREFPRGGTHHCRLSTLNNFQLISGDILPIDFSAQHRPFLIVSTAIVIVSRKLLDFIVSLFFLVAVIVVQQGSTDSIELSN